MTCTYYLNGKAMTREELSAHLKSMPLNELSQHHGEIESVPEMPFSGNWHQLALKRALHEAAKGGYDRLTWTPGQAQADRYDLSQQVKHISWGRKPNGNHDIIVHVDDDTPDIVRDNQTPHDLENLLGKEVADRILNGHGEDKDFPGGLAGTEATGKLVGPDLKVGGEGMKGFYDRTIPQWLQSYTKPWGGKVGTTRIHDKPDYLSNGTIRQVGNMHQVVGTDGRIQAAFDDPKEADDFVNGKEVHSLDITPEMRAAILSEGQPLWGSRNAIKKGVEESEEIGWADMPLLLLKALCVAPRVMVIIKAKTTIDPELSGRIQEYLKSAYPVRRPNEFTGGGFITPDGSIVDTWSRQDDHAIAGRNALEVSGEPVTNDDHTDLSNTVKHEMLRVQLLGAYDRKWAQRGISPTLNIHAGANITPQQLRTVGELNAIHRPNIHWETWHGPYKFGEDFRSLQKMAQQSAPELGKAAVIIKASRYFRPTKTNRALGALRGRGWNDYGSAASLYSAAGEDAALHPNCKCKIIDGQWVLSPDACQQCREAAEEFNANQKRGMDEEDDYEKAVVVGTKAAR